MRQSNWVVLEWLTIVASFKLKIEWFFSFSLDPFFTRIKYLMQHTNAINLPRSPNFVSVLYCF